MFVAYLKNHIIARGTFASGMLPRYLIWLADCFFFYMKWIPSKPKIELEIWARSSFRQLIFTCIFQFACKVTEETGSVLLMTLHFKHCVWPQTSGDPLAGRKREGLPSPQGVPVQCQDRRSPCCSLGILSSAVPPPDIWISSSPLLFAAGQGLHGNGFEFTVWSWPSLFREPHGTTDSTSFPLVLLSLLFPCCCTCDLSPQQLPVSRSCTRPNPFPAHLSHKSEDWTQHSSD